MKYQMCFVTCLFSMFSIVGGKLKEFQGRGSDGMIQGEPCLLISEVMIKKFKINALTKNAMGFRGESVHSVHLCVCSLCLQ